MLPNREPEFRHKPFTGKMMWDFPAVIAVDRGPADALPEKVAFKAISHA